MRRRVTRLLNALLNCLQQDLRAVPRKAVLQLLCAGCAALDAAPEPVCNFGIKTCD